MKITNLIGMVLALFVCMPSSPQAANAVLLGWNNLGMHCMDSRYAEFAILPPYNTVEAQLIINGKLITNSTVPSASDYRITYEATADPTGSINTSSVNKSDWITYAPILFGLPPSALPSADYGLAHCNMPGALQPYDAVNGNIPQEMLFQPAGILAPLNTFHAEGIPITPEDDAGNPNNYPLMKLVAKEISTGTIVAESKVVLPVSDEMSCKSCHAPNTNSKAMPAAGWITAPDPDQTYRLNVLKLHDEKEFASHAALYQDALAAKGINANGLYASATADKKPVLCASCHASEALGAPSFSSSNGSVPPLTQSVHNTHAGVVIPGSTLTLNDSTNRDSCYSCHPGSKTHCLRGAMGSAVATDGTMEMQCQSCHGNMSKVGDIHRTGWLNEPTCQSCHTGTATQNNGQIRYATVFDSATGTDRIAVNPTFATNTDTPAPGLSLYRFSKGHGGLQCEACHGSTHAEFPSSHSNDNIRNIDLQGHAGVTAECTTCHNTAFDGKDNLSKYPSGVKGPHGLHPMNQTWATEHHDFISSNGGLSNCQSCHGKDYRGTELSRVQGDRTFNLGAEHGGTIKFYRGATVGCYSCHNGVSNDSANTSPAPVTQNVNLTTQDGQPVAANIPVDQSGVSFRVLQQPKNGTVGIVNGVATYHPYPEFTGTDSFTFAGYNGSKNTNTGTNTVPAVASITVNAIPPSVSGQPASQTVQTGNSVSFSVTATGSAPLSYQWYKNGGKVDVSLNATATSAQLTLSNVGSADASSYYVVVSNSAGSTTSNSATLTVQAVQQAPVIINQPGDIRVALGKSFTLQVGATGTPAPTYQWFKNGTAISGATASSYTVGAATASNAGSYTVKVSNSVGSVTSASATVTVTAALTVKNAYPGYGTVSSTPSGINCGKACAANFSANSNVALKALPTSPHKFKSWSGCTSTSGTTCTVTMSKAKTVTVNFVK